MKRINDLNLFCGDKDGMLEAKVNNMVIINALRYVRGYECHKSVVGWTGKGCPKDHPEYLYAIRNGNLYLNLIDGEDIKYIPGELINQAVDFINESLAEGKSVYVCCSKGESRSPSIILLYLLKYGSLDNEDVINSFRLIYPNYNPAKGMKDYVLREAGINHKGTILNQSEI
jgi:hypothetical protein